MSKYMISLFLLVTTWTVHAQSLRTQEAKPLADVISARVKKVSSGKTRVPLITWGGDVATIYAEQNGIFRRNGLDVTLSLENHFPSQVARCLEGDTPYLRGTMGMINAAAEVFEKKGVDLVVIYQLTWSNGGDALVVRPNIKTPKRLKGKTIALQLYGPHMDYLLNILDTAGVPPNKVDLKWFSELTLPTFDTKGEILDPVNAFLEDKHIDAAMCIIPDALSLTSGGRGGSGAAGSVKGAKIMLSTKTASRVIADVYAVRSDYLEQNRGKVEAFVKSLMEGEEGLRDLMANKASQRSRYQQTVSRAADLLLGAPQAVPDVEGLLADCEFVGYDGNVAFFTGKGTRRTLATLTREIQSGFLQVGLIHGKTKLADAEWNYAALAKNLKYANAVPKPKKKFDTQKVVKKIEKRISVEPNAWAEDGTLFQVEINFQPNQSQFSESQYAEDFSKALDISQTYGGSLIVVEGHSDPLGIARARQKGTPSVEIAQMEQQAKNLSLERSRAVRRSFLKFATARGIEVDGSQFIAVGLGVAAPKFNPPRTKQEWAANRRVVFRIKQVEAELSEFVPLD